MSPPTVHSVTISYAGHDLHPPIFVAGSFTHPPWRPYLMDTATPLDIPQGIGLNRVFTKVFKIPEGRWQYKFRLGYGDWWVCDPKAETAQDKHGNYNNILLVGSEGGMTEGEPLPPKPVDTSACPRTAMDAAGDDELPEVDEDYQETPLMPHESPSLMKHGGLEVDPGHKGRRTSLGVRIGRVHTFVPPEPTKEDLTDPELERFPGSKAAILTRMHTLRNELPIDDSSHLDGDLGGFDPVDFEPSRVQAQLSKHQAKMSAADIAVDEEEDGPKSSLDGAADTEYPNTFLTSLLHTGHPHACSYGTLRPLMIKGHDGADSPLTPDASPIKPRTKAKYVSFVTTSPPSGNADNASVDDQLGRPVEVSPGAAHRKDAATAAPAEATPKGARSWIDRFAAGTALVFVGVMLIGGWIYITTTRERL